MKSSASVLAVADGVRETGRHRSLKGHAANDQLGPGVKNKLLNSWHEKDYPNDGFDAAAFIYTKAANIIDAFATGATIRAHGHSF